MGAFGLAHLDEAMWRTHEGECFSCAVSKALSTVSLYLYPLLTAFRLLFRKHYLQLSLAVHQ